MAERRALVSQAFATVTTAVGEHFAAPAGLVARAETTAPRSGQF